MPALALALEAAALALKAMALALALALGVVALALALTCVALLTSLLYGRAQHIGLYVAIVYYIQYMIGHLSTGLAYRPTVISKNSESLFLPV